MTAAARLTALALGLSCGALAAVPALAAAAAPLPSRDQQLRCSLDQAAAECLPLFKQVAPDAIPAAP